MYHLGVFGCFIWDLFETSWRRTDGTSSLSSLETLSWHTNKTSWRRTTETYWWRSTEMPFGVSFETYLRRRWDVQRDVVTTSPWRLVTGWVAFGRYLSFAFIIMEQYSLCQFPLNLHSYIISEAAVLSFASCSCSVDFRKCRWKSPYLSNDCLWKLYL